MLLNESIKAEFLGEDMLLGESIKAEFLGKTCC
jgi:hypothetical protein